MRFRLGPAVITLLYAALAAVWIVASAVLLDFLATDPVLHGRIEVAKGLAFVITSSAFLYLLLRRWERAGAGLGELPRDAHPESIWRPLAPLLAILVLTVPLVGFAVFSLHARQDEQTALDELRVIAGFKATQIENWLRERRGDGTSLAVSRGFVDRVEALQRTGDPGELERIRDRLGSLIAAYGYETVVLLGGRGQVLLTVGEPLAMSEPILAQVRGMARAGVVQMDNLDRDAYGHPSLNFVVPLGGKGLLDATGTVVLHMDAKTFLDPQVESWPAASRSGETNLVRREGDTVLYLNGLRHRKDAALQFRLPLGDTQLPAAAAARDAGGGSLAGVDYRGVPVLAAWQPVAGTDWKLLAKVDRDEALEPARATALWTAGVTLFAAVIVAVTALLLFRQQRLTRRLAAQMQADTLLRQFYDLPFVGMAITSPETKHWLNFNDRLCTMFGYTREELAARTWAEMTHPDDLANDVAEYERVMRGESVGYRMEKRYFRKDGSVMFARIDVKCVRTPEGAVDYFVCMIEDISEQKAAAEKILRLSRLYRTLSDCNAAVVRCTSEKELYAEVCRAAVESGGLKMAWVGLVDPATRLVKPVASFGANLEYLDGIRISVDGNDPNGRGPTGTSIRNAEPFWCQDFANDPRTAPWRERAAKYGWGASAGLPLYRAGVPIGALTLYGAEPNTLDAETRGLMLEIATDVSFGLDNFEREGARRRGQDQLIESEERFRGIVEQSIAGLYIFQDGKVAYVNPRLAEIFGYASADEVIGRDALAFFAADQRAMIMEKVRARLEGKVKSLSYTTRGIRKDGSVVEVDVHGSVATYRGRPAIIGLLQDISEKKRAEEAAATYLRQLQDALMRTVEVATTLSEMRDPYTTGHEKRVAEIAVAIAAELGFDAQRIEGLRIAGYLHDIGKITIPSEILSKPGRLSPVEYSLIKGHPQAGYDVLKNVEFPWPVADMVLQHHERIDGSGYPQGLRGDAILLEARILAVCDVVEAMASHRPYRPGLGMDKALAEIERGRGTAYDPQVADACLALFRDKGHTLPD